MQRRRQHRGNATRAKSTGMQSGRPRAGSASSARRDISGKGSSALDHIVPIARGGTSEPGNLQLLCRRCNIRKRDHAPDEHLDRYMERKVATDRILDMGNEVLPPIVDRFIWQDSTEAACPWCKGETKVVQRPSTHDATVFRCPACKRHFRAGHWDGKEDFYQHVHNAIFYSFSWGEGEKVIELLKAGDIEGVKGLVGQQAGPLVEVCRRRHSHRVPKAAC